MAACHRGAGLKGVGARRCAAARAASSKPRARQGTPRHPAQAGRQHAGRAPAARPRLTELTASITHHTYTHLAIQHSRYLYKDPKWASVQFCRSKDQVGSQAGA